MTSNKQPKFTTTFVLLASSALTIMAGALIGPSLSLINQQFHNSELVAMLLTMPSLAVVVTAPLAGKLINSFGKKWLLIIALALYGAAGSTGLWMDSLQLLLLGRFVLGVSVSLIMTVSSTFISDLSSGYGTSKLLSYQATAMNLGGVIFVGIGGYLAQLNWRMPFSIYLLAIVVLILAIFFIPDTNKTVESHKVSVDSDTWKSIIPFYLFGFISMLLFYQIPVIYSFIVTNVLSASPTQTGVTLALFSIASAIASMQMTKLFRRYTEYQLIALAFISYSLGHLFIAIASNWPVMITGGVLTGVGLGIAFPTINKAISSRSDLNNRGMLMSGFVSCYFLGQFASPIAVQLMRIDTLQSAFYISSAGAFILGVLTINFKQEVTNTQSQLG
ncbi:MFS transporter [Photobacterium sp. J15]|uniref:MFS transporter n=1 Tax=Photobacterium sp. J15 TaxID=265901 RepID=UPI0007E479B6|nr:MFS transporter [Photobacterium sp. J15]